MPEPTRYRTRTGHNWAPHIRREPGEDVTDMPAADRAQELADGTIEAYTPDDVTVAHLDDLPGALNTWQERMGQMSQAAQDGVQAAQAQIAALTPALERATQQQAMLTSAEADAQSAVDAANTAVTDQQAAVTSLQTQYRAWQTAANPPRDDPESEAP